MDKILKERWTFIMREGVLVPDTSSDRMDIRFGLEEYYGGLHCGDCMDVLWKGKWKPTRIEMTFEGDWYLVGIKTDSLVGLRVRV